MPSQEDYLDELLKNLEKGEQQTDIAGADEGTAEMPVETSDMAGISDILGELPESADFSKETVESVEIPESIDDLLGLMGAENGVGDISAGETGMTEFPEEIGQNADLSDGLGQNTDVFEDSSQNTDVLEDLGQNADLSEGLDQNTDVFEDSSQNTDVLEDLSQNTDLFEGLGQNTDVLEDLGQNTDLFEGLGQNTDVFEDLGQNADVLEDLGRNADVLEGLGQNAALSEGLDQNMDVLEDLGHNAALFEDLGQNAYLPEDLGQNADLSENLGRNADLSEGLDQNVDVIEDLVQNTDMLEDLVQSSDIPEEAGTIEYSAAQEAISDLPAEDPDIEELLRSFDDSPEIPAEETGKAEQPEEPAGFDLADLLKEEDIETEEESSMSEDDIERLLAANRETAESNIGSSEEEFQGDVVDLLQGTDDSELQEIQDLLEKSDNNEAVGSEIEALLQGNDQGNQQGFGSAFASEANSDTDDEDALLTPKQRKALEKKRLKEEKAAAKKAAKEAKKAKKAGKKTGIDPQKAADNTQSAAPAASTGENGAGGMTEEPIDTAFLDSILSEANKITSAENISSATGNYDAKVGKIMQDEGEDIGAPSQKKGGASSSGSDDLGIDMSDLFGDGASAENSLMTGGELADLPDFEALDGGDVTGILELAGEEGEETKPKKKGFFSRFLEFLTEEDDEEEENENIKLSEENQGIIEELDKEKKDKKGKKGKKKAKKADASAEDGEEGEEGEEDKGKKGKKKKEKKPKKEKLPKEEEPVEPGKKLGLKKVLPVLLSCLSLGVVIIIIVFASVDFNDKKAAKEAYYNGDYLTCYQNLFGKDLDETEQIMYGKSEAVLRIRLWLREYEWYVADGEELEALDSLIQSVNEYPVLYEYATQWNAAGEVAQEYSIILNVLYEKYGLTEDQARAIAAEPDDIEYTRQVNAIVQGGAYGSWNEPEPVEEGPLPDELPEETDLPEGNFIDTNSSVQ